MASIPVILLRPKKMNDDRLMNVAAPSFISMSKLTFRKFGPNQDLFWLVNDTFQSKSPIVEDGRDDKYCFTISYKGQELICTFNGDSGIDVSFPEEVVKK